MIKISTELHNAHHIFEKDQPDNHRQETVVK